jgi:hypothetical protein
VKNDKIAPVSRRPGLVVVVCVALLLATLPGAVWAHPWHPVTGGPGAGVERGPVNGPVLPHHAAPPPLALAAGAIALLAVVVVRRRPLALGLVLVVALASFEGVFHAALHLHHVSHTDGLAIGASAAAPTAPAPDAEIPAAPTPVWLGPAPDHCRELCAGIGHASRRGRAPPALPA